MNPPRTIYRFFMSTPIISICSFILIVDPFLTPRKTSGREWTFLPLLCLRGLLLLTNQISVAFPQTTFPSAFWVVYWSISWRSVWPGGGGGQEQRGPIELQLLVAVLQNSALWFTSTWKHPSGWSVTPHRKLTGADGATDPQFIHHGPVSMSEEE